MTMDSAAGQQKLPPRTQASLQYLRRLKPSDGYAIERYIAASGKTQMRLKRRDFPVRDEGFEEIVVDRSSGHVVGIQVLTSKGDVGRGIALVDKNGKICSSDATVTVKMVNASTTSVHGSTSTSTRQSGLFGDSATTRKRGNSSSSMAGSRRQNHGSGASSSSMAAENLLANINNEDLVQYGLMALGALLVLKVLSAAINVLTILLIPLLYLYATTNCPTNDTFDAKKELKRVMRGAHLPEEHQPKGFFEQSLNRLAASVTTELATSLGYEVSITDYFGAAKMAAVKVPVAGAEYFWVGVFGKWRFVTQREIAGNKND